jgi:hypothetical protein
MQKKRCCTLRLVFTYHCDRGRYVEEALYEHLSKMMPVPIVGAPVHRADGLLHITTAEAHPLAPHGKAVILASPAAREPGSGGDKQLRIVVEAVEGPTSFVARVTSDEGGSDGGGLVVRALSDTTIENQVRPPAFGAWGGRGGGKKGASSCLAVVTGKPDAPPCLRDLATRPSPPHSRTSLA